MHDSAVTDAAAGSHRRRNVTVLLAAVLVVVAVAAGATALLDRHHPDNGWVSLPDPLALNQHTPAAMDGSRGQTFATAGGQGNGTITATGGRGFPTGVLADIVCRGEGYVSIAGVGAAGCFDGSITAYEITRPTGPLTGTLTVTAPPGLTWRVTVSAYTPTAITSSWTHGGK